MATAFTFRRIAVAFMLLAGGCALADPAPFDLMGPTLDVKVTRGAVTLPITKVPNLAVGDRLLIKFELPTKQSAHYVMVAAFLRGPTNPPPATWFHRCDTWTKACAQEGLTLTVPADAGHLLVFFAPETGGDYKTLMSAVQGRPGAFVRAAQELNQAALDRSRLGRYLAALRDLETRDPGKVKEAAPLLARSLAIKVDEKCLDRIPALQAPCLMQGQESLILSDGRSTSMVETLTSGAASDLAMQAGRSQIMNSGAYLPFIGSILDIARLMDSFHTAKYQYIPALALAHDDKLTLMLNTPPSFHDPRSVLVAALPAVELPQLPPLHNVDARSAYCMARQPLVLAVDGAPLVFATDFAHDLTLEVAGRDGTLLALPTRPDARLGGFVVDTATAGAAGVDEERGAALKGYWGFEKFDGPQFQLANLPDHPWAVAPGEDTVLVVGREDTLHLVGEHSTCLEDIKLRDADGKAVSLPWKAVRPDRIEVRIPLADAMPGERVLEIKQFGVAPPQSLRVSAFAAASRLDGFVLHAGDVQGALKGTRLDQVQSLSFRGVEFAPEALSTTAATDELAVIARDGDAAIAFKAGDDGKVAVKLRDGRELRFEATVAGARPRGSLVARNLQRGNPATSGVELGSVELLPVDATLTFSVRAQVPASFTRDAVIEVASVDGSFGTKLGLKQGGLALANARVAIATLDPAAFGPSAFGPLQFRLIEGDIAGDWMPLGALVRLPQLEEIACPADPKGPCQLKGAGLYLIDSLATMPPFRSVVPVAEGFASSVLTIPHPADGRVYFKLRDNPGVINSAVPRMSAPAVPADVPAPVPAPATAAPALPAPAKAAPN